MGVGSLEHSWHIAERIDCCSFIVVLSSIHSGSNWNVNRTLLEARHHSPCRWPASGNTHIWNCMCARSGRYEYSFTWDTCYGMSFWHFESSYEFCQGWINQKITIFHDDWWLLLCHPSQRIHFYQAIALLPWTWPSLIFPTVWRVPQRCHWQDIRAGWKRVSSQKSIKFWVKPI